jgi:acetyl-CoA carboxylase biotin carboxyl carrier protein
MNIKEIKDLLKLMNDNGLNEIEFENEGLKIKLKRSNGDVTVETPQKKMYVPSDSLKPKKETEPSANVQLIKSPMVGTFYSAPAPDAEPYVKVGSKIEVGQVVCIIEAMKLMNEIKSEVRGVIADIYVQNGEAVEFSKALFTVSSEK